MRDDFKCGTTTGYAQGCRCQVCRDALNEYQRAFRTGVRKKKGRPNKPTQHGTANAYVKRKCRCRECRLYWREYTREQKRRIRGSAGVGPRHSICVCCGKDFVPKQTAATCSTKCATKSWRDRQRSKRKYEIEFSERSHAQAVKRTEAGIAQAIAISPDLAQLIEEQAKDQRTGTHVRRSWEISLDATLAEDGSERHELFGSDELDPASLLIQAEQAALLKDVTGGRTEEEISRLDYHTQEWLANKLRENGLAGSISVTRSERERLRPVAVHSGERITSAKGHGGRAKRAEKLAMNRHSRPSRKPRKRWTRQFYLEDAA